MFSVNDICEYIWELEAKYNLLNLEISGVMAWECSRFQIYIELAKTTNLFIEPHPALPISQKISNLASFLLNSFVRNPFKARKCDVVVIAHPRVKNVNGKFIDIYTHYLIEQVLSEGKKVTELEGHCLGKHIKHPTDYTKYTDLIILLSKIINKFILPIPRKDVLSIIDKVNSEINFKFNCTIDLNKIIIAKTKEFKSYYILYYALLKKLSPSTLYLVVSYFNHAIIKAAKDLGIETIELQHGSITKYHMGYSFPCKYPNTSYFPDKLYTWNEFWKFMAQICPLDKENINVYGFEYQKNQLEKYKNIKRNKETLLVLSQTTISNAMAIEVLSNFYLFKHMQIIYKLHPGEYSRWQNYPALVELSTKENVKIIADADLYELFFMSEYQAGVYSTALFEGAETGCKTILFNLPGLEYMTEFIEFNDLRFYNNMYLPKCFYC